MLRLWDCITHCHIWIARVKSSSEAAILRQLWSSLLQGEDACKVVRIVQRGEGRNVLNRANHLRGHLRRCGQECPAMDDAVGRGALLLQTNTILVQCCKH